MLLAAAAPVDAQVAESTGERVAKMFAIAGHALDLGTTQDCVARGTCREVNPLMRPCTSDAMLLAGCKAALAGAGLTVGRWLIGPKQDDPPAVQRAKRKRLIAFYVIQGSVMTYVAVRNRRVGE